jgi:uncharacterized protein (TIGR03545 family)
MKQWIRWSGLVGFIAISALLVLGWLFAAGPIIKYSIETFGSQAANAKVEVENISLTFDPFGIEIEGLQVANAEKPMENLLQFDRAVADIELLPLLLGKGIVNEVALTGLAFSTPRQSSGAIEKSTEDSNAEASAESGEDDSEGDEANSESSLSQQAMPTAAELLSREPLLTEQRGTKFKTSVGAIKENSDKAIAALPDGKALASYEDDFKRITSGRFDSIKDFQQRKKEFDDLKKRIKQDQQAISQASKVITEGKKDLQSQWSGLQKAPGEDFKNLKSKYQLDGAGIANLSRLLFGDKVGEWSQEGLYWYEKARPFLVSDDAEAEEGEDKLESGKREGRFVHYETDRPLPDLLIRQVQLAVQLGAGQVAINIYDITHQQHVIDRPTRIVAKGEGLKDIQSLNLTGSLDHRVAPGKDVFDLNIKGMALNNYDVGAMGLKLDHSQLDIIGQAELIAGEVDANTIAQFTKAKFSSKDKTQVAIEMGKALANIDRFDIQAKAKGDLTAPDVKIESDLDTQLSQAFNQRLKEKQRELEAQLKQALNEKLLAYGGDYKEQLKALDLANGSLADKQSKLKQLASSELSSFQDQQEADAKRKLEQEKKAQQAKLAEEKRKAKAKAKAAADKKKKQLENEAKEKFKKLF